jgi:aminoglycoside 3-N-acetyltransferase
MDVSILTKIGIIFKYITGVNDISAMKKDIHKKLGRFFYHQKYNADQVITIMQKMGMKRGSTICIHAAMKEFYNYRGTADELIQKIMAVITTEGTLMMPAYPDPTKIQDEDFVFDIKEEPTQAGCLAETFRRMPGVIRSVNVQHSVCAWGKEAIWLTQDHNKCINCWDENSPWYRMTTLHALVFTFGLSATYIGTFDHCVEATLYKEHPYWAQFLI